MPLSSEVRAGPIDLPLNSPVALPSPAIDSGSLPSVEGPSPGQVQHVDPDSSQDVEVEPMVITVTPAGPAFDVVSHSLGNKVTETYIDLSDDDQVRDFL